MTARSFSLGRVGEARWEQMRAGYLLADWPHLADALREHTVVPTLPEVLAMFDDGTMRST